jgi:hypothetical protein
VAWFGLGFGWEEVRWSREDFRVGPRGGARVGAHHHGSAICKEEERGQLSS